jgi:hypothetical protein
MMSGPTRTQQVGWFVLLTALAVAALLKLSGVV